MSPTTPRSAADTLADLDRVQPDPAPPARADVVVVGGGIVGVSTAFALARKGVSVALCEKGPIAGEQSSRNWGWCRQTGRDTRELALIQESLRLWGDMDRMVEADTGFRACGALFATDDDARIARYEGWLAHARRHGLDSRLIAGAELDRLMPCAARRYKAALYTPGDGCAEPTKAAPAIAEAARRHGASVLPGCAVRGVETAGGRVAAVVTEQGRIACERVVVAGGAWSRLFCRPLGVSLPQLTVRATAQRTEATQHGPEPCTWTAEFAIRRRRDGGYTLATSGANEFDLTPDALRWFRLFRPAARMERRTVRLRLNRRFVDEWRMARYRDLDKRSPYEAVRVLEPTPSAAIGAETKAALDDVFPAFREVGIAQRWAGLIDVTPDTVPVISEVEAVPGLVLATGFSGYGFGIGPAAGRLAADLAAGDPTVVDLAAFRLDRFERAPPRLEAWL